MKKRILEPVLKWETEAGGWQIEGQLELLTETLSQEDKDWCKQQQSEFRLDLKKHTGTKCWFCEQLLLSPSTSCRGEWEDLHQPVACQRQSSGP